MDQTTLDSLSLSRIGELIREPEIKAKKRLERRRRTGKWDNQTTMRTTFELRNDLTQLAVELEAAVRKGRAKPWWDHDGGPYLHEVVAWLLRQYRDLQRRRKRSAGKRKQIKEAKKAAGLDG